MKEGGKERGNHPMTPTLIGTPRSFNGWIGWLFFAWVSTVPATHGNPQNEQCDNHQRSSSYRWVPEAQHPCTVVRMSSAEFLHRFGPRGLPPLYHTPLVIQAPTSSRGNHVFREMTRLDSISEYFGSDFNATLSSSNSFSEHRKTVKWRDYLQGLSDNETLPHQLSNETWYFFGETYSDEWKKLLLHYELPNCHACVRDMVSLSFGIGNRGSGVQWHVHGPGFSETIWGRKHWILQQDKPDFHPDQTSRNWMEHTYMAMSVTDRPLECTLEPGDMLYFPDMWYHATINLDAYTAFVSTFTQEHLFVRSTSTINV